MNTTLRAGLASVALVAGGLLAAPVAATAAAPAPSVDHVDVTAAEADRAVAYWTPARMRAAEPAEAPVDPGASSAAEVEAGAPITYGEAAGAAARELRATPEAPVSTIGKVFFTLGGQDYVCSANSVSAANDSVVSTAGHCVFGEGQYVSRWIFVPAYENGSAPYGEWPATGIAAPTEWTNGEDSTYDVAFVQVETVGGQTLADAVGATAVAFNQARGLSYEAFGYPAAAPFDGETLQSCAGASEPDPFGQTQSQGIPCDMTGGSSGGPWFLGSGAQNSVNSFGYRDVPNVMFGPYFGDAAQQAYEAAAAA